MQLPHINIKSPTFIKLATLFIVLFIIFVPKGKFLKLFTNGNSGVATAFTSATSGDWNDNDTWGVSGPVPLDAAQGLALSSTGEIYVGDTNGGSRVVVLNPDGTASTSYNNGGNFYQPSGIAFSAVGEIYVADQSQKVYILNPDGTASTSYDGQSSSTLGTFGARGVAVSSSTGKIYVTDSGNSRVIVFNSDGTVFAQYDNIPSGFAQPNGITLAPSGEIYIADMNAARIVVLNPDGTASTTYDGSASTTFGSFVPQGITIALSGEIYITDSTVGRVVVLNPDGTASTSYSNSPTGLVAPGGIALSSTGEIYVADANRQKVYVLNPDGTASTSYDGTALSPSTSAGVFYPGISDNVNLNTGTITLTQDESVHNLVLASGGTLDLNGHTLNVYGDWSNTGGTLINNGGTVNFVGTSSQYIIGANTFENLTKITTTTSSLLFDPNNTTTITGDLILQGALGNLLSIGPFSTPVFSFKINGFITNPGFGFVTGVTLSPTGEIYATDRDNDRIVILNPDGTASTSYSLMFANAAQDVAISSSGKIYSANQSINSVVVLNPDGTQFAIYDNLDASYSPAGLSGPNGVTLSPTGEIYIADGGNNRIVVLNPDGTASTTFDNSDASYSPSGLNNPQSITFSPITGGIYVTDPVNDRGVIFNANGTASTTFADGANPIDIKFSPTGEIYIVNQGPEVIVLNPDGTASTTYDGQASTTLGSFYPLGIDLSPTGEIYLADYINYRIVVLNPDGTAFATYDNTVKHGSFSSPQGIAYDSNNNIYITDTGNSLIQEYDKGGHFIKTLDTTGIPSSLAGIGPIATDVNDNIYVIDNSNLRLVKFDSTGVYATSTGLQNSAYALTFSPITGNIYYESNNTVYEVDQNFALVTSTTTVDGATFSFGSSVLAVDQSGEFIYAVDGNNSRVVKLNASDLSFVSSVGNDTLGFNANNILSIAYDSNNNIYVIDGSDQIIVGFSPDFSIKLFQFGSGGSGDGQFTFSYFDSMIIDSDNNIYVSDTNNNRIQKFSLVLNPFTINYTGSATTSYSYLSVSSSTNISSQAFSCLTGCVDGGANTNWIFPTAPTSSTPVSYGGSSSYVSSFIPVTNTTPEVSGEITATTTPEVTPTPITPTTPHYTFTQTLKLGSIGEEVRQLQIFLNKHGFSLGDRGVGSSENETTYFGTKTKQAVIKFQETYANDILTPQGLTQGTGIFLNYSRAKVNSILENE